MLSFAIYESRLNNSAIMFPGECYAINTTDISRKENRGYLILTHGSETIRTMPRQEEILLVI